MRITWKRSTSNGADRGVTLVEMMVVVVVFAALVLVFLRTANLVEAGTTFTGYHNRVSTRCQRILNRLAGEIAASVRLYPEGQEGRDLLALLVGVPRTLLAGSLLPVILPRGIVAKDPPNQRATGNCLLWLQAQKPFVYEPPAPGTARRIDVYRVVCVYLRRKPKVRGDLEARPDGLDLVLWRSVPLLDRAQVERVPEPTRTALLKQAYAALGARLLFDLRRPVRRALGEFDAFGVIGTLPPDPYVLPADPEACRTFCAGTDLSVATNGAPRQYGVARFARRRSGAQSFPHGFEVRVLGSAAARQVVLHLTLCMYGKPSQERAYADLTTLTVARDF